MKRKSNRRKNTMSEKFYRTLKNDSNIKMTDTLTGTAIEFEEGLSPKDAFRFIEDLQADANREEHTPETIVIRDDTTEDDVDTRTFILECASCSTQLKVTTVNNTEINASNYGSYLRKAGASTCPGCGKIDRTIAIREGDWD